MRTNFLALCLLIPWLAGFAQPHRLSARDPRWRLWTNGKDSLVVGPYTDFALMDANRTVADNTIMIASDIIEKRIEAADVAEKRLNNCAQDKLAVTLQLQEMQEKSADDQIAIGDLTEKVAALRPWATVAKVQVYALLTTVAVLGANEVFNFIPSINIIP